MFWSILFGVLTAAFAVFGLVCAIQHLIELLFPLEQLRMTVELHGQEDAEHLEMLMHEAKAASCLRGRGRLVVLLPEELTENGEIPAEIEAVLERYRADCYLIGE